MPYQRDFWGKVEKTETCWNWTGYRRRDGYGLVNWVDDGKRKNIFVHRVAYEELVGPIPEGLVIDHLCRNHACVNPEHLEPVTIGENVMRGDTSAARYAQRTHCKHGHEFTPENLKKPRGRGRECRTCDLNRKRTKAAA